mmetsp:Transcript_11370/g.35500  ORF Transcript_11370/g.35500 Transcript_11370/m.35500 type:complete len:201 (+) Transcript_11370:720-1322(+)
MGGRAPWPMMYCLSWGSHFFVVLHTQPSNAFVTMQTTPRVCATLMTWITASCTRLMASRTSGRSGRGWPNHAGIWFCQSKSQPPSSTAQCHWSAMWSLRIWRIQLVGQSVSSQSKITSVSLGSAQRSKCERLQVEAAEARVLSQSVTSFWVLSQSVTSSSVWRSRSSAVESTVDCRVRPEWAFSMFMAFAMSSACFSESQ